MTHEQNSHRSKPPADKRRARLAAELRANLLKRKDQARARGQSGPARAALSGQGATAPPGRDGSLPE